MKMTTLYTTAFLVCLSGAALAIPQAPHDAAHNVSCADCHTPYAGLSDPVASVGAADATSTSTTFVDLGKTWTAGQWVDGVITFTSGLNIGQFRTITASDATSVSWALPLANAIAAGDTYKLGKTVLADIETKCTSCHNPTGPAYTMSHVGLHQTDTGAVSCSKCHEPHNMPDNSSGVGNGIMRKVLRIGNGIAVIFPSGEASKYVRADNKGLCQVCHTKTKFYKADGSGAVHVPDLTTTTQTCTDCHKHDEGFGGAALVSAHNDATAAAFTHFANFTGSNAACARCHSGNGFVDFIGADGTPSNLPANNPDNLAALTAGNISCSTCHNAVTNAMTTVTFPSGTMVGNVSLLPANPTPTQAVDQASALCMTCHQGRQSTPQVDTYLATKVTTNDDTVSTGISFQNVHYLAAGATLWGGFARGGYQYSTKKYDVNNRHVASKVSCVDCHNQHTLELRIETCGQCHAGVTTLADLPKIRMYGSTGDYDGDGNVDEGIKEELDGLAAKLLQTIQKYAHVKCGVGKDIVYDGTTNPYWFIDTNGDGVKDATETTSYNAFTKRLLRATYNYQFWFKDPGAYAHGPKYDIELMTDSILDLNSVLGVDAVAFAGTRIDAFHFDGTSGRWRFREPASGTPGTPAYKPAFTINTSCIKCHGASDGIDAFQANPDLLIGWWLNSLFPTLYPATVTVPGPVNVSNGMACTTCHARDTKGDPVFTDFRPFPTGVWFSTNVWLQTPAKDAACENCHMTRDGTSYTQDIANSLVAPGAAVSLKSMHGAPAASVMRGSEAHVGYQLDPLATYAGTPNHNGVLASCAFCHDPKGTRHTFVVADAVASNCSQCHTGTLDSYRNTHTADYDGDGNTTETLNAELQGMAAKAVAAVSAVQPTGSKVVFCATPVGTEARAYPYMYKDTNNDGICQATETSSFSSWNTSTVKVALNVTLCMNDPGASAHNFAYCGQILFDSVTYMGGSTAGMVRP